MLLARMEISQLAANPLHNDSEMERIPALHLLMRRREILILPICPQTG